ncbi:MAG TPA: hypothetical protein VFH94_07285 [Streptomyces sp.]|nr:hypothetical protein [Streptomyces sp.]
MATMILDAPRRTGMQHLTSTGSAIAVALLPLAVGVLLAKTMAGDPMAPVNALITGGGPRAPISPSQWRRCGRTVLSGWQADTQIRSGGARTGRAGRPSTDPPRGARAGAAGRPGPRRCLRGCVTWMCGSGTT